MRYRSFSRDEIEVEESNALWKFCFSGRQKHFFKMVWISCILVPVFLFIWHKFIQPLVDRWYGKPKLESGKADGKLNSDEKVRPCHSSRLKYVYIDFDLCWWENYTSTHHSNLHLFLTDFYQMLTNRAWMHHTYMYMFWQKYNELIISSYIVRA